MWEDIVKAVIGDDPARASELLYTSKCLLTQVRGIVKGQQIELEEIAQEVQLLLLTRWQSIRSALVQVAAGKPTEDGIKLLRWRTRMLIMEALKKQKPTGISLNQPNSEGEESTIDPAAPEDDRVDVAETVNKFWNCVSRLKNIRSRVLIKFLGILEGATHERAKLTKEEEEWRPAPNLHPNSIKAREVAIALKEELSKNQNLAAPNEWLGEKFKLTARKPQDVMASWVYIARGEFAETFAADRDDLLN